MLCPYHVLSRNGSIDNKVFTFLTVNYWYEPCSAVHIEDLQYHRTLVVVVDDVSQNYWSA